LIVCRADLPARIDRYTIPLQKDVVQHLSELLAMLQNGPGMRLSGISGIEPAHLYNDNERMLIREPII
jgi:hypothetical protein